MWLLCIPWLVLVLVPWLSISMLASIKSVAATATIPPTERALSHLARILSHLQMVIFYLRLEVLSSSTSSIFQYLKLILRTSA